jgi:hypothetical protein
VSDWRERAACVEYEYDRDENGHVIDDPWFPDNGDYAIARMACGRCPVKDKCTEEVLKHEASSAMHVRHGMWAGMTPDERSRLSGRQTKMTLPERRVLYDRGLSDVEIARICGTTADTIDQWRRYHDLPRNGESGARGPKVNQERWRMYEAGLSDADIAEQTGVKRTNITKWRAWHSLPMNGVSA